MTANYTSLAHCTASSQGSRYIADLKRKAEVRKKYQDQVQERLILKEQAAEDHLYGDKEKFVTPAYIEKMKADKLWREEELKRDAKEERDDVTKKGDMSGFYRNLMTKNEAFGATREAEMKAAREAKEAQMMGKVDDKNINDEKSIKSSEMTNTSNKRPLLEGPVAASAAAEASESPAPKKRRQVITAAVEQPKAAVVPGARLTAADAVAAARERALARRKK